MLPRTPLLLASGSPRRRELLASVGVPCRVEPVSIDESPRAGEAPSAYLERITSEKLAAALALPAALTCAAVLVADTIVVVDGVVLGKPAGRADARRMLGRLTGRGHEVATRFAVQAPSGRAVLQTVTTQVAFRAATDDELDAYVESGECDDKAGAYAVQGLGGFLVRRVEGSYSAVVGLPVCEVCEALVAIGAARSFPLR